MAIWNALFGGSGNPVGTLPDTENNGNNWSTLSDDATFNIQSGYCGITGFGTGTLAQQNLNPLAVDSGTPDVVMTAIVWDKAGSGDGVGVCVRATDQANLIAARISQLNDTFVLEKVTSGTKTSLDSESVTIATQTEYTIVLTANGTDITAELFDSGANLLSTLTATESDHQTVENHGIIYGRSSSLNQRCMSVQCEEAAVLGAAVDPNGYDIVCNATSTSTSNYSLKVNGGAAFNPARVIQRSASTVALTLPNDKRILSTDTVTMTDTAGGFTDEAVTNNSLQTATTVAIPTVNGGSVVCTFASAPTVGILASGEPTVTNAVNLTGITYTAGTGEEQYKIGGAYLNPAVGPSALQPFHPDAENYSAGLAASFPLTLSEDDCLLIPVTFPDLSTHATSTAFSVGDAIEEGGRYWRVADGDAGTTAGTKPSFPSSSATVTDGTVTWTRGGDNGIGDDGRSLVRKMVVLHCSGATLKSQDTYRCPMYAGSTKTYYTRSDLNTGLIPGDTNGFTDVSQAEALSQFVWYDPGRDTSGASEYMPEENCQPYGEDMLANSAQAVFTALSDANYTDNLIDYCVQRGIDQIGCREGGSSPIPNGGWAQGKYNFALFAIGILELGEAGFASIRTNSIDSTAWDGTEFGTQHFYITQADIDRVLDSAFEYNPSSLDTYVNPTTAPTTYTDSPSNAYFPASVRGTWLHVPEWGLRHTTEPDRDTPLWSRNDVENYYRTTANGGRGSSAYIVGVFGLVDTMNAPAFFDFIDRYENIEAAAGDWDYDTAWTLYQADRPAFAFTASAVIVGGTWYIDLNFNRYATQTNANILSQFGCSGSITLSNADQTGPRTFRVQASADPRGETITYTESGTAANRVVDSGDNELPTASTATVIGTQELQLTINPTTTPTIVASGGKLDFGKVAKGTLAARSIEIENTGDATLKLDLNTATITSTDVVNYFAKGSGSWNDDEDVAPDGTLQLAVTFNSGAATLSPGTYTAVLSIPSNDANSPFTLNLSATVVEVGPSTKGNWGINTAIKIGV